MATSIEVHIEELILHGFAAEGSHRIAGALREELARLLAMQAVPTRAIQMRHAAQWDSRAFRAAAGGSEEAIGTQVARSVFGSLSE
jgi:hypothetical protein